MSIFEGLHPNLSPPKDGKDAVYEKKDGSGFISRESRHSSILDILIEVLFPNCTFNWPVISYFSHQGKGINRRNENIIVSI